MSRILGILVILGLTAPLLGCGILDAVATGSEDQPPTNSQVGCLNGQFFRVEWYVDSGPATQPLSCGVVPSSHVEFRVNTNPVEVLTVIGFCSDGSPPYNFAGLSNGQIPAGAAPTSASLISDINGGGLAP